MCNSTQVHITAIIQYIQVTYTIHTYGIHTKDINTNHIHKIEVHIRVLVQSKNIAHACTYVDKDTRKFSRANVQTKM